MGDNGEVALTIPFLFRQNEDVTVPSTFLIRSFNNMNYEENEDVTVPSPYLLREDEEIATPSTSFFREGHNMNVTLLSQSFSRENEDATKTSSVLFGVY